MENGQNDLDWDAKASALGETRHARRWPRLLSINGVAEYLSVSPNTVRTLNFKPVRIGRRVLFDIRAIDLYVDMMSDLPIPEADRAAASKEQERRFFEGRKRRGGE